ncbi:MAG TPA: hypothetical protein DEG71_06425 [Clostridiales bacterium]|nr:hypothetical protein [Clostridiales bacterium]
MKLIINEEMRGKYPALRIGIIVAKNVRNQEYLNELKLDCEETFSKFMQNIGGQENLESQKNIGIWREVYRSFGMNPKKKKPTAEALLLRTVKSNFVPHINPAVDAYLMAETLHYLPIGGYDIDRIDGDIILRISVGNEDFLGVGSDATEKTDNGEIVYADKSRILTRCWNYRDCDYSKIDLNTSSLALFVEAPVNEITDDEVIGTLELISNNLKKYCNAETQIKFLNIQNNDINIV